MEILDELEKLLGNNSILTGDDISERYCVDWSGENKNPPLAVIRPRSTADVSSILKLCNEFDQKVVVQGGMTGLSGGATPRDNEIAISMERMTGIEEIDRDAMTLTVKAGTALQQIHEAASTAGVDFPLDLGARGSCNIGGNIATNAGGNQVIRYGMMRSLVLGLEAVLADGTVISNMNKLLKNNAGYDLKHLLIGTEGTLGIITRAVLRIYPKYQSVCTALCALDSLPDAIKLLNLSRTEFADKLNSYEVMWKNYYDYVVDNVESIQSPFSENHNVYALIEIKGNHQEHDGQQFEQVLEQALESGYMKDAAIAQSTKEADSFWAIRDGIGEILTSIHPAVNFDIGIPIGSMAKFLQRTEQELQDALPGVSTYTFGHIGDGNIHYLVTTGRESDKQLIGDIVYRATGEFDGSVSAEHGIGTLKRKVLNYSRNESEIELMRKLKSALDPKGILNNGRII